MGNVIFKIDAKAAMEVLKEYLPEDLLTYDRDWMRYAISLALCLRAPSYIKDQEYAVRGVPALRMAAGSIAWYRRKSLCVGRERVVLEPR